MKAYGGVDGTHFADRLRGPYIYQCPTNGCPQYIYARQVRKLFFHFGLKIRVKCVEFLLLLQVVLGSPLAPNLVILIEDFHGIHQFIQTNALIELRIRP
jgi:hypothetical protein